MGLGETVLQGMRTLIIYAAGPLWIAAIVSGIFGRDGSLWIIFGQIAFCGTILGAMRARDASAQDGTHDAARLILSALIATRKQPPAADGLHLVVPEESESEPPAPRQSAG